ncbi:MAG TPA: hypothetical protein VEQ84_12350, partial [Vicinamibacteria bacterium]|nr:hypothetical protein [Vicinamibacteria bacterium]
RPRLAVTGARAAGAFRWPEAESALVAAFEADRLRGLRLPPGGLLEDLFADAAYRSHLTGVLARRAVTLARGPAPAVMVMSHGSRIRAER